MLYPGRAPVEKFHKYWPLTLSVTPAGRDTHSVPDVLRRQTHWRHLASETDGGREFEQGDVVIGGGV